MQSTEKGLPGSPEFLHLLRAVALLCLAEQELAKKDWGAVLILRTLDANYQASNLACAT